MGSFIFGVGAMQAQMLPNVPLTHGLPTRCVKTSRAFCVAKNARRRARSERGARCAGGLKFAATAAKNANAKTAEAQASVNTGLCYPMLAL